MMLSSMVTRPKSMATVVVVFWLSVPALSMPAARLVIGASVLSGEISDRAPTVVVLPTPKPPEIKILTGIGGRLVAVPVVLMVSEGSDTVDQPFDEENIVRQRRGRRRGAEQDPGGDQV